MIKPEELVTKMIEIVDCLKAMGAGEAEIGIGSLHMKFEYWIDDHDDYDDDYDDDSEGGL